MRHGPGANVFSHFIEPNGFVAEYTTESTVDEATTFAGPEYWRKVMPGSGPLGRRGPPTNRMRAPCQAALYLGDEPPVMRAARTSSGASSADGPIGEPGLRS
jgi:hypothetical protein